jgi:hypothetical protein
MRKMYQYVEREGGARERGGGGGKQKCINTLRGRAGGGGAGGAQACWNYIYLFSRWLDVISFCTLLG